MRGATIITMCFLSFGFGQGLIKRGAFPRLHEDETPYMEIFVKGFFGEQGAGKNITLEMEPSDTIADVKAKIWCKEGILPSKQRLSLLPYDHHLQDNKTLSHCNIQHGSILQVTIH